MSPFDVSIIGGGLIGLACAEALAQSGRSVVVLEQHARFAQETSSRNSGVVHAGIHYPPDSLKAKLCVRGRHLLAERGQGGRFPFSRIGKLIVATTDAELSRLEALERNAAASGVDLVPLDAAHVQRLEPALRVVAGLFSPESAIVDPNELANDYRRSATSAGALFSASSKVIGLEKRAASTWQIRTRMPDGAEHTTSASWVINAAGLDADAIAALAGVDVERLGLTQHPCKGSYFALAPHLGRSLSRLVYPLPYGGGLGIHLTLDLAGGVRAGPDAEYVTGRDYSVDEAKREVFAEAIGRFLPGVRPDDFTPAYAGIRPKLAGPGDPFRDFVIRHEAEVGLPGLINLLGIESPGLTASPAIAEIVSQLVGQAG